MPGSAHGDRSITALLPSGFRDPSRPSGGNNYDVRLLAGLRRDGWRLAEATVPDPGPEPSRAALKHLDTALSRVPDGTVVLADGLVTTSAAAAIVPHSDRLAVVVLLHLPRALLLAGDRPADAASSAVADSVADSERRVLAAAAGVITTSRWTAAWLAGQPELANTRVTVAPPGVDPAPLAAGAPEGSGPNLLFLGRITAHKGIDVLVRALGLLTDISWQCWCVGPADDAAFAGGVRRAIEQANLSTRLHLTGTLTGTALADRMHATDLLLVPSRFETYGMVITEALARGIPVVATDVGGIGEALGSDPAGHLPGVLIPPDDPTALAAAIRDWLRRPGQRRRWRDAARWRRDELNGWDVTAHIVADALAAAH